MSDRVTTERANQIADDLQYEWTEYRAATDIRTLAKDRDDLLAAAKAVVERWDTPSWKDAVPTGEVIGKLRRAIARAEAARDSNEL
jgi:hypothetical protein